jgi:hypothetical protein
MQEYGLGLKGRGTDGDNHGCNRRFFTTYIK